MTACCKEEWDCITGMTDTRMRNITITAISSRYHDDNRFRTSSANTRATSRAMVVLPTPGRPLLKRFTGLNQILNYFNGPENRRPTRQVNRTIVPFRLRIAEIRCRVLFMPARLSSPKLLDRETTYSRSRAVTSWERMTISRLNKRLQDIGPGHIPRPVH